MGNEDFSALCLTLELASLTTILLLVVATPLAWWLTRTRSWITSLVGTIVTLPLVLPPTVLGFYILVAMGPDGFLGYLARSLGLLPFTFPALLLASVLYSLPFAVQPLQTAFEAVGNRPMEVAATLRASPIDAFFTVALPLAKPGFITASILSFSHTLGEFGIVLMIGGNIPYKTRVLSIQIYNHVEALEYTQAHWLAGGLLVFSFLTLMAVNALKPNSNRTTL